jgi:hypothetical protein
LKAENEILRRRLATAEAKAQGALAELSAITRIRARAAALGDVAPRRREAEMLNAEKLIAAKLREADERHVAPLERSPWWRRLARG